MPLNADWARIRRDRLSFVTRLATRFILRAKSCGINLEPDHIDQKHLARSIEEIVDEYLECLIDYKTQNGYEQTERIQPSKVAALLAFIVAYRAPIRTGTEKTLSWEASIANAYFAWRIIQVLLRIDGERISDEFLEYLIRSLHNIDKQGNSQQRFREDWAIPLTEAMQDAYGLRARLEDIG